MRTLISRDFDAAFAHVDVLVSPSTPVTAFKIGEKVDDPLAMYYNDRAPSRRTWPETRRPPSRSGWPLRTGCRSDYR